MTTQVTVAGPATLAAAASTALKSVVAPTYVRVLVNPGPGVSVTPANVVVALGGQVRVTSAPIQASVGNGALAVQVSTGVPGAPGPPGPAGEIWAQDTPTPTNGQTVFTLSQTPKALGVQILVNGESLINGYDFTVSGTTVTLLSGLGFSLSATDKVQFRYPEF